VEPPALPVVPPEPPVEPPVEPPELGVVPFDFLEPFDFLVPVVELPPLEPAFFEEVVKTVFDVT
jgi:hypothetical protein